MFPTFFFFLFPQCSGNIFFLHWILFFFLSSSLSFGINNEFQKFFYSIQFLDSRHESKHTHIWNKSFLACFLNTKKKILILNFKLFVLFWLLKRKNEWLEHPKSCFFYFVFGCGFSFLCLIRIQMMIIMQCFKYINQININHLNVIT